MSLVPLETVDATQIGSCLVTGGAGFLGRQLLQTLRALGCEARSFDLRPSGVEGVDDRVGDIRDAEAVRDAVRGVDTVFHAAAVIVVTGLAPPARRQEVWDINEGGTANVVAAARVAGVGALVLTSSANVCIDREIHDESEAEAGYGQHWVDLYGPSKAAAERIVLAADTVDGLRTCALRPGGLWGGGEAGFMLRTFLAQLAEGRFVATIGDGTAVADNTHVDTLIWAELLAAEKLRSAPDVVGGQAYFITDDERVNGVEWFRPVTEGLGVAWPRVRLPGTLMYAVGWLGEVAHRLGAPEPPLTRIGVLKLTRSSSFRVDKARAHLGWRPLIQHREGLRQHLDDYRVLMEELGG